MRNHRGRTRRIIEGQHGRLPLAQSRASNLRRWARPRNGAGYRAAASGAKRRWNIWSPYCRRAALRMAGEGIVLRSSEDPRPGPNEILPRVRASSLNYRDLMVLKGGGRGPTKLGVMPLSDGAGEVAAIGEGVTLVKVGDRVIGTFHPRWFGGPLSADYLTDRPGATLDGMLAEYAVLSEEALVPVPSHLSFEEAATLPLRRSDRLGRTGGPSSGDRRRHRLDAGFGRCLGFCAAICPGLGCPSDRDDLDRRKGRAAQRAGCLRGDQLHRDAGLGREGARVNRWPLRRLRRRDRWAGHERESLKALTLGRHVSLI